MPDRLKSVTNWLKANPSAPDQNPDNYGVCQNKECTRPCRVYYRLDPKVPRAVKGLTKNERVKNACSDECLQAYRKQCNEHVSTDEFKAKRKAYKQTSKGAKANQANTIEQRKINRATKPGYRLHKQLTYLAYDLASGKHKTSPPFFEHTGIQSEDLLTHLQTERLAKAIVGLGCIEHKIAQVYFDFTNPEDVIRCWMLSNVTVLQTREENSTKGATFVHTPEILAWPEHHFPTAWAQKFAHNAAHPGIPTEDEARELLHHHTFGDPR